MEFEECIKFANENPVSWVATVENDQPRVRALGMWFADKWAMKTVFEPKKMIELVNEIKGNLND